MALEAVVELSSQLADDKRNDIRIEAALAKLYCSEMGSRIVDELVQIRGGRGYETAESLAARGERGVPAEQMVRDMRINRIFEGSSEIMRLFIAREAVDAHLAAAGDLIEPGVPSGQRARAAAKAGGFYAKWLPTLMTGEGQRPGAYGEFGPLAEYLRYVERASRKLARATFYGMARWQGKLERKQGFLGRIVDIGAELFAISATCFPCPVRRDQRDRAGPGGVRAGQGVLRAGTAAGRGTVHPALAQHRRHRLGAGQARARGPLHLAGGGRPRPVDPRAVDRRRRAGPVQGHERPPPHRLTAPPDRPAPLLPNLNVVVVAATTYECRRCGNDDKRSRG